MNSKTKSKSFEVGDIVMITGNIDGSFNIPYHPFAVGSIGEVVGYDELLYYPEVLGLLCGFSFCGIDQIEAQFVASYHLEKLGSVL